MSSPSPAANAAARRLLATVGARPASEAAEAHTKDFIVAAEQGTAELADVLSRWFGPYGYHALLTRALAQARREHPVLAAVRIRAPLTPLLDGLQEAAQVHGTGALTEGAVALVAAVLTLLGRVIGEDMALQLMERGVASPESKVAPDDTSTAMSMDRREP